MITMSKTLFSALIFTLGTFSLPACTAESPAPTRHEASPQITNQWAIKLAPGTDPEALAKEYGAKLLKPIGSLKDTWLLQRPDPSLPDNRDPLRQDNRVLWLERQFKHKVYKRPPNEEKSNIK